MNQEGGEPVPQEEERSESGGKVIHANVRAQAGAAAVAVNQAEAGLRPPFYIREEVHHRVHCDPETGAEKIRRTIIESVVLSGEPPEKGWHRFLGVGKLVANDPQGRPIANRDYRFAVVGDTVEQAWANFDACLQKASVEATDAFRAEYAAAQRAQQERLLVPGSPGAAQQILGPGGRPLGNG